MRRGILIAVVLFNAAAGTQVAKAVSYETGTTLWSLCEKPEDSSLYGFCTGYIIGVADVLRDQGLFCPPKGHTKQQIVDVTVQWLRDHRENQQSTAFYLVSNALAEKFPCQ